MDTKEDVERGEIENVQIENNKGRKWETNNEKKFAKVTCSKKFLERT
jgi:uncharacterized protein Veg